MLILLLNPQSQILTTPTEPNAVTELMMVGMRPNFPACKDSHGNHVDMLSNMLTCCETC